MEGLGNAQDLRVLHRLLELVQALEKRRKRDVGAHAKFHPRGIQEALPAGGHVQVAQGILRRQLFARGRQEVKDAAGGLQCFRGEIGRRVLGHPFGGCKGGLLVGAFEHHLDVREALSEAFGDAFAQRVGLDLQRALMGEFRIKGDAQQRVGFGLRSQPDGQYQADRRRQPQPQHRPAARPLRVERLQPEGQAVHRGEGLAGGP